MTIQSVKDVTLSKIPNLDSAVTRAADQIASVGVESNTGNTFVVSIVMLNQPLRSNVPNLD